LVVAVAVPAAAGVFQTAADRGGAPIAKGMARHAGTIRCATTPIITTLGPHGRRFTPSCAAQSRRNAEKDSLEISLRMADWLALHPRRQTHDR
jgi:hypothetical protein